MSVEVVLDIESGSVGAGVVTDGVLSHAMRIPFGRETPRDARAYVPQLKTALESIGAKLGQVAPSRVRVVVSAPWYLGVIAYHAKEEKEPTRFTMSAIRALVPEPDASHGVLVESGPIAITINGYRTRVRVPLTGRKVGVRSYTSFIDVETEATIHAALEKTWPHARVTYHTFPHLAPWVADAQIGQLRTGEILVRVGAEASDVCLMFNESVLRAGMLAEGARSVTRRARPDASVDAEARFALLTAGELSEKETLAINKLLLSASEAWRTEFSALIAKMADAYPIPSVIRVLVDHESKWFKNVLTLASAGSEVVDVPLNKESTDVPLEILTRAILQSND